ncbi:MAG: hypothetical protein NT116_02795 [Candidatus Parcubacteria bacterium]|nr:hypothetical protein [Candidatus Parcubacteria bacterium]
MEKIYKVIVDYTMSLAEMFEAGKYTFISNGIAELKERPFSFCNEGAERQEVKLVLIHPKDHSKTKEVLDQLDSQGLEPAKIEHLLAFGAAYPAIQCEVRIIALDYFEICLGGWNNCPYLDYEARWGWGRRLTFVEDKDNSQFSNNYWRSEECILAIQP